MEVNDAVAIAKQWISNTYKDENLTNLGLEEIDFDGSYWTVTIGFSRPWDQSRNIIAALNGASVSSRTLKVVTVDDVTKKVVSLKNR